MKPLLPITYPANLEMKAEIEFEINMNVYANDIEDVLRIDRLSISCMTNYEDTLNSMRFTNPFMYIKDWKQTRPCFKIV